MNILLLSGYDADSHKHWRKSLVRSFPLYSWTVLSLPARHFSWRIRGNSLSWGRGEKELLAGDYDLLIATSMVDLATLRGIAPRLSSIAAVLYFHENQFAYPASAHQKYPLEPKMVNLYAALSAEILVFNTRYNQDSFLQGVEALLEKLPDAVPDGIVDELSAKARVIPVALDDAAFFSRLPRKKVGPINVLWNHRWEYDKGPEKLLGILECLPQHMNIRVHIVGRQFRQVPKAFDDIAVLIKARGWQGEWGFIDEPRDYQSLLKNSDLVLSTALHDFQGLSVLEAVAAGCIPIVPDRLAYTELFSAAYRYRSQYSFSRPETHGKLLAESEDAARHIVQHVSEIAAGTPVLPPDIEFLSCSRLTQAYKQLICEAAAITSAAGADAKRLVVEKLI